MSKVTEIADDVYRISLYLESVDMQINHFLVRDDDPLLFHTGMRGTFPEVVAAASTVLDPATLRWIAFSHYEADECGALDEWLQRSHQAQPLCSILAAALSVNDQAARPARRLADGDVVSTGAKRFRFLATPHLPHGWDAGLLFEETTQTLFCSDLFDHGGDPAPVIDGDIVGRARDSLAAVRGTPFDHAYPYTAHTSKLLADLAACQPRTLALMHGSSFAGDCPAALLALDDVLRAF